MAVEGHYSLVSSDAGITTMTYARKPKPAPKCCVCQNPLYGRSELLTDLDALCFVCLSE